jgi:hypothetical protein
VQVLVDHRQQQLGRRPPHVDAGLADRGQGRDGVGSHVDVVVADQAGDRRRRPVQLPLLLERLLQPLLYAGNNPDTWTLAISLQQLTQLSRGILANLQMVASILFTLPVLVIFFLAQKVFVEGVTLTGVRG